MLKARIESGAHAPFIIYNNKETMKAADRYALTADGLAAKIGTEEEIRKFARWNRVLKSPYEWDMYWVSEDKVVNTDAKYSTPPSTPLVDKLFSLLPGTALEPKYHYEMWWVIKWLKEQEQSHRPGLVKVGRYSCDLLMFLPVGHNLQEVEDAYRHYKYWIDDFKSGDAKDALLVSLRVPKGLDGDAMAMNGEQAIALLELHMNGFPDRPKIVRDYSTLHFYTGFDSAHYHAVRAEAEEKGLLEKFDQAIAQRCINYADNRVWYRCALFRDRAPMSFGWRPETKDTADGEWRPMFPGGGGLIYHESMKGWSTHT